VSTFTQVQDLAFEVSRAASSVAPAGWSIARIYSEFLPIDGDVDQVTIVGCLGENGEQLDLNLPFSVRMLVRSAFEAQTGDGSPWTAIGFKVEASGRYSSAVFYGAPLHLNGDIEGAKVRMASLGAR